ncbi:MAG: magnesium transporter [Chlamydiota bacterium]|nr:magnesium transporter [Chlamydiota bacterium]
MRIDVHKDLNRIDLRSKLGPQLEGDYVALRSNWKVQEAIDYLRSHSQEVKIRYFPIVDETHKLVGVTSSHNLLLSDPIAPLNSMMATDPISLSVNDNIQTAIEQLKRHKLVALPVVDDNDILQGVVEMQVSLDSFRGEAKNSLHLKKTLYNDIFQLIGISIEEGKSKSSLQGFSIRMPWLLGNLVAGFTCAAIAGYFQEVMKEAIILAMFIPLVLTLSESISMQAMTMSLNFLHTREVNWREVFQRVVQELKTALLLGFTAGLAVECIAFIMHSNELPLFIVAVSIFCSMSLSAAVGVIVPVIVHSFHLDPKVAAGPVALMFADVCATALYLGFATWWIL